MLFPILLAAAATSSASQMVDEFRNLCPAGISRQDAGAKAKALHWHLVKTEGEADTWQSDGQSPVTLTYSNIIHTGEHSQFCGIKAPPVSGAGAAVRDWIGFPPSLDMATSFVYFLIWDGTKWTDGGHLPETEFSKEKAAGRAYSLMFLAHDEEVGLFWIRSQTIDHSP